MNYVDGEGVYSEMLIDYWFQKCIEEFPKSEKSYYLNGIKYPIPINGFEVQEWFTKWFSQFTTKGDE